MPTFLTAFGECKTLLEWTRDPRCIVSLATLVNRLRDGWEPERALTEPSNSPADRWRQPIIAFGLSQSLLEWERDPRAQASAQLILSRLRKGWRPEEAISTAAPASVDKPQRPPPKLYHGKSLNEWIKDPRCQVSRYTLERNLRAHMPLEQALVYRKRRRAPAEVPVRVESVSQALKLMDKGGELWHYVGGPDPRVSILADNRRYDLPSEMFKELVDSNKVRILFSSETTQEYGLTGIGVQHARSGG